MSGVDKDNTMDRSGEYGLVGAEQADETHYDRRSTIQEPDADDNKNNSRIVFSKRKLYGRDKELETCLVRYQSIMEDSSFAADKSATSRIRSIFLAGYSGSGKSAIVKEFVKRIPPPNTPLFLAAKFEELRNPSPLDAWRRIFDFQDGMQDWTSRHLQTTISELDSVVGEEDAAIVGRLFPALRRLVGDQDSVASSNVSDSQAFHLSSAGAAGGGAGGIHMNQDRLYFVMTSFFQLLCTATTPVVLFLDDLQWADPQSLELMQALLTDKRMKYLFFVGAYRSNEVSDNHPLTTTIQAIEKHADDSTMHPEPQESTSSSSNRSSETSLCVLELNELQPDHVSEFLADSLDLTTKDVEPLTQAIYSKTLGNPLFTEQAVEQLVRNNSLYYDTISFSWSWNLRQAELEDQLSDDIVEMVRSKIQHLSGEIQTVLSVASCTRSTFEVDTLAALAKAIDQDKLTQVSLPSDKRTLTKLLQTAVQEGLLTTARKPHGEEFSFVHDRIQEAAYSFVAGQTAVLSCIAHALYTRAMSEDDGEDWMFFAAAQILNAIPPASSTLERTTRAHLNLCTAERSLNLLAFGAAKEACARGLDYLLVSPVNMWKDCYDLALKLYSIGASAELRSGSAEQAESYCQEVLQHKRTTVDAIPVYKVYLDILSGKGRKAEVIDLNLFLLKELGISFPKGERMQKIRAWALLKQIKAQHMPTETTINNMERTFDPIAIDTMEFLQKAGSNAFAASNMPLYSLICMESVKGISKYGLTDTSATALATFANVLMHIYGDFETSARLAELAILLTKRWTNKFGLVRALNTANNNVLGWVRPLRTRLPYHLQAYEWGKMTGNVEGAAASQWISFCVRFYSAAPLGPLEGDMRQDIAEMRRNGHGFMANLASILWQIILNLLGKGEANRETTILTGEAMDATSDVYSKMPLQMLYEAWRTFAFCIFGDFESGAKDAMDRRDFYAEKAIGMMYGFETFHRVLSLYAMSRKGNRQYHPEGQRLRKKMNQWVSKGCVNLKGPTMLLNAEHAALSKKFSHARELFEKAIELCGEGDFHQYKALSQERYATFLDEQGEHDKARELWDCAATCYRRWGATRKVELLLEKQVPLKEENQR